MIIEIINSIIMFAGAVMLHEFGHALVLWYINRRRPEIRYNREKMAFIVGNNWDYNGISHTQYVVILLAGIVLGMIPLLLLSRWYLVVTLILYLLLGCRSDFKNLMEEMKNGYKSNKI